MSKAELRIVEQAAAGHPGELRAEDVDQSQLGVVLPRATQRRSGDVGVVVGRHLADRLDADHAVGKPLHQADHAVFDPVRVADASCSPFLSSFAEARSICATDVRIVLGTAPATTSASEWS